MIIGIDGPAGSGKSSITKIFEEKYEFLNLNTGATYRALALLALDNGYSLESFQNVSPQNLEKDEIIKLEKEMVSLLKENTIDIVKEKDENGNLKDKILLNGKDITLNIKDEKVSKISAKVSMLVHVKKELIKIQQKIAAEMLKKYEWAKGIIAEGRDICTLVFKDAEVKIYLDAKAEERAKRRYEEYIKLNGESISYEEILKNILERDHGDKTKKYGALICTDEHTYIDTTNLNKDEVVEKIMEIVSLNEEK